MAARRPAAEVTLLPTQRRHWPIERFGFRFSFPMPICLRLSLSQLYTIVTIQEYGYMKNKCELGKVR